MNLMKKFIYYIKNIFTKKPLKQLDVPHSQPQNRDNFKQSIKTNVTIHKKVKKVETPICVGDGLGFSGKMGA